MARGQAETLMGLLCEVLEQAQLSWSNLDAIGVGTGPGNFTGIRISVSAARGIGLGLRIPVVGVSLFDTTHHLSNQTSTAVPAPRNHFYSFDPNTASAPVLTPSLAGKTTALSSAYSVADHVTAIARIAARRADTDPPPPKPLYVKPPDAAPARDTPPRMLP